MKILQNRNPVLLTDTFNEWRIKFNDVLNDLKTESFATTDEFVTREDAQLIDGIKTFSTTQFFNGGLNTQGISNFAGDSITINTNNNFNVLTSANGGSVRFIGSGINFLTDITSHQFTLGYDSLNSPTELSLKYSQSGADATFTLDNGVTLGLENSKLKVGSVLWNLPSTSPTNPSLLRWSNDSLMEWQTISSLSSEISPAIESALLANSNFQASIIDSAFNTVSTSGITLAVDVIPVGTTVEIDATAVAGWPSNNIDSRFPGWLLLDGRTITTAQNAEYSDLIKLIANSPSATSAVLPNSTTGSPANFKIIKYKKDPVSNFKIVDGDGIILTKLGNPAQGISEIDLLSGTVELSLKINNSDFSFNSGSLTLNNSVVKRDSSGNIQSTVAPVTNNDLTNKLYVDSQIANIASLASTGSTITLGETIDGFGYNDSYYSMSLVNKDNNAVAYSHDYELWDQTFYANSIVKNGLAKFKKSISTIQQQFFIDEDDIIYGRGFNNLGQIAQNNRGNSTDFIDYYRETTSDALPYNKSEISHLFPALLPQKSIWDANAVTVDYITGPTGEFGSTASNTNITVKTKDGVEPVFVVATNPRSGLVKLNNNSVAYTRGYILSNGFNQHGQFGRGDLVANSAVIGSLVWGPRMNNTVNFPGRSLWLAYGVTSEEYSTTSSTLASRLGNQIYRNQLANRFNFYKPNAITAGGLGSTLISAISTWRSNTGLPTQQYSDYNWFVKKIVRTNDAHYVIVGKPGSEVENEIWAAGRNVSGAMGHNHVGDLNQSDFMPMLAGGLSFDNGTYTIVGDSSQSNVFRRTDNAAHIFSDFENITIGTATYVILTGDVTNNNRSTQFRLINKATSGWFNIALSRLLEGGTSGLASLTAATLQSPGIYRRRLRGVYDLHASTSSNGDSVIMKRVLSQIPDVNALDSLSESAIITNEVLACGRNSFGEAGVGTTATVHIATQAAYTAGGPIPSKVISVITLNDRNNTNNTAVLLDSNGRVWTCGSRESGLSGFASTSANQSRWTQIPLNASVTFSKMFITHLNPSRDFSVAGISDSEEYSRLFLVGDNSLFAAGSNHFGSLGTSEFINSRTQQYVKIKFPENVNTITEIRGFAQGTLILCKNNGDDVGRVYYAGQTRGGIFSSLNSTRSITEFKNIDKFLS